MDKELSLFVNYVFYDSPKRMRFLVDTYASYSDCRMALSQYLEQTCQTPNMKRIFERRAERFDVGDFRRRLESQQISVLFEDQFPELLRQIHDAPPLLYYRGHLPILSQPMLGLVGSRNMTDYGRQVTYQLSQEISRSFVVVSGLAAGVDAAAHTAALDQSSPTVAVVGTGLDIVYPVANDALFHRIVEHGLVLSEFPPGTQGMPHHFPQRNRIVAGLSCGVLVTEAGEKSGALITARLAMEENREVFAVPGSIHSEMSKGPNRLLMDGAKLVRSVEDVLAEVNGAMPMHEETQQLSMLDVKAVVTSGPRIPDLSVDEQKIFDLLGGDGRTVDALVADSGLGIHQVLQFLTLFEMNDWVEELPGKKFRCKC